MIVCQQTRLFNIAEGLMHRGDADHASFDASCVIGGTTQASPTVHVSGGTDNDASPVAPQCKHMTARAPPAPRPPTPPPSPPSNSPRSSLSAENDFSALVKWPHARAADSDTTSTVPHLGTRGRGELEAARVMLDSHASLAHQHEAGCERHAEGKVLATYASVMEDLRVSELGLVNAHRAVDLQGKRPDWETCIIEWGAGAVPRAKMQSRSRGFASTQLAR